MRIIRRVLLLALVSVSGIALLSPLSARSAIDMPVPEPPRLLAAVPELEAGLARGGVLAARGPSHDGLAAGGAEAVEPRPAHRPTTVTMEATLVVVPVA